MGLGEMVVQGAVNPDEFYVHNRHLQRIARLSCAAPWGRKKSHGLRADPGARQAG